MNIRFYASAARLPCKACGEKSKALVDFFFPLQTLRLCRRCYNELQESMRLLGPQREAGIKPK